MTPKGSAGLREGGMTAKGNSRFPACGRQARRVAPRNDSVKKNAKQIPRQKRFGMTTKDKGRRPKKA